MMSRGVLMPPSRLFAQLQIVAACVALQPALGLHQWPARAACRMPLDAAALSSISSRSQRPPALPASPYAPLALPVATFSSDICSERRGLASSAKGGVTVRVLSTPLQSPGLNPRHRTGPLLMLKGAMDEEDVLDVEDIPPLLPDIASSAIATVDLRIGVVISARTVVVPDDGCDERARGKPSRTTLALRVDIGVETRQIVAPIRQVSGEEEAVGKRVIVIANIPPETVMGLPSHGKLLTASNPSQKPMPRTLRTVVVSGGRLPPGSRVDAV